MPSNPFLRLQTAPFPIRHPFLKQNQILITHRRLIPFNIPPRQKRLDHFRAFRIFRDQTIPRSRVDYKGFVQAGFDAVIDFSLHVFAQRFARFAQFVEQVLHRLVGQRPAGIL